MIVRTPCRSRVGRFAATLTALLLLAGRSDGAIDPERLVRDRHPWIRADTAHFTVFSNAGEKRAREIGRRLEVFRSVLARLYDTFQVDPPVETFVYVFRDAASFAPFQKEWRGRTVEAAGLFVGRPDGNYVTVMADASGDPLAATYHESIHHFMNANFAWLPLWFNEGIAECYSTFKSDGTTAHIGLPVDGHVHTLRQRPPMSLRELFGTGHDSAEYNEDDRRGIFYAQSWALVHYLLWDQPLHRQQLARFLEEMGRGTEPDRAFTSAFATTLEQMERDLRRHIEGNRFHFTTLKFRELVIPSESRVTPLSRAEALVRLADLLVHLDPDRRDEGEALLGEALALDPSLGPAHAGLGFLATLADDPGTAIPHLEKAAVLAPADYRIAFHLAQALARRGRSAGSPAPVDGAGAGDAERARALYEKVIERRPSFGEAYLGLAALYERDPDTLPSAIGLYARARSLLPSRRDIVARLALALARAGDHAKARAVVENTLRHMGDVPLLERVRTSLASYGGTGPPAEPAAPPPDDRPPARPDPGAPAADGAAYTLAQFNTWVAAYNEAVGTANAGDFKTALALLEELLPRILDQGLAAQVATTIQRMREDAKRLKKPIR